MMMIQNMDTRTRDILGIDDLPTWLDSDEAHDLERLWRSSDTAQIGSLGMMLEVLVDEICIHIEDPLPTMVGKLQRCVQLLAVYDIVYPTHRYPIVPTTAEEGS